MEHNQQYADNGNNQYLMFKLGADTFGIAIEQVREIIEYPGLTSIPLTPAFMRGVINLRGAVVPVIDLSVRFGRAVTAINRRSCVVVIEAPASGDKKDSNDKKDSSEKKPLGIIVDGVTEVLNASADQIEQRPEFGSGLRADFVASVLKRDGHFVLILDLAAALSFAELETLIDGGVNNTVAVNNINSGELAKAS